jgi:hypothetical protein
MKAVLSCVFSRLYFCTIDAQGREVYHIRFNSVGSGASRTLITLREAACLPPLITGSRGDMAERVCVFVDGENFRHSIGELFNDFNRADYLPKNADWGELFDWLEAIS